MLRDVEFRRLHQATLGVLERVGLRLADDELLLRCEDAGLSVDRGTQSVRFSGSQVEDALASAPKEVRLYGRGERKPVVLGGRETLFMPSGTGVAVLDPDSSERRESRAADVRDLVRLQETLTQVDVVRPMVTALEFEGNSDLVECYLSLRHSGKPFLHRTLSVANVEPLLHMGALVAGGLEALRRRPPFAVVYCPKSPLSFTYESARCAIAFAEAGVPVLVLSMAMGGGTAPATLGGQALLINAEVLGGITLVQTLCPGAPVLYGSVASVLDMQTAILALGAPERGLLNGLCAELARRYRIPSVMGGLSTDAKMFDEQAGFEKAMTVLPLLGKADMIFGMGMMDSAGTYSAVQLVLDDEFASAARRMHRGVDVGGLDEERALVERLSWSGEYLTTKHTLRHCREYWRPRLMTRANYERWAGADMDLIGQAQARTRAILAESPRSLMDLGLEKELGDILRQFGIDLPANL